MEAFWDLLIEGRSGVREVPADRWDADEFFAADPGVPGRAYSRHGGFIEGVRCFDAGLFGIPPREAVSIDPQHRLVLEVAWEALEHAGMAPDSLRGTSTGVFMGMGGSDYERLNLAGADVSALDGYAATGSAVNFAANRLSYTLGLQGPSLVVDTACSSSLVALHLAGQALRNDECDTALAGGVNLLLSPGTMVALCQGRMLSFEGLCKTFDASADGYVRGEGCGVVVLQRLSTALQDKHEILAIITGSAINQDGRSNGLTAPRGPAQQDVIRRALAVAGLGPGDVGYVEAHGTGTALGDPIEVRSLAAVLGQGRDPDRPLMLGSVKTNIGHLEAAAGIAGFIKAVLAAGRGIIPAHLNLSQPNPLLAWDELPLRIPTSNTPWPDERRIAGVSSFGFGGTNAHVVLEAPPTTKHDSPPATRPVVVKLAAKGTEALRATAARWASFLHHTTPAPEPTALAWSAGVGRANLSDRAAVIAASTPELLNGLRAIAHNSPGPGVIHGPHPPRGTPKLAFLAPGQGARIAGALEGLYGELPALTRTIDTLTTVLGPIDQLPLSALLHPTPGSAAALTDTAIAQPALYALAVSLGTWWRSLGIHPDVVTGHSIGAYAAAALAGVFPITDGARLITTRAQLMAGLPCGGAMAAVLCAPEHLAEIDSIRTGRVAIAAYNSSRETVVSGREDAVAAVMEEMSGRGFRAVRLRVSCAFHSAEMEPVMAPLAEAFAGVSLREPELDFVSDLTGEIAGPEVATADYWVRHTREAVRFSTAIGTVLGGGTRVVVELGPGGLLPHVASAGGASGVVCVPSVTPGTGSRRQPLESLARIWAEGLDIDWTQVNGPRPAHLPKLPTYPFQRTVHWLPTSGPQAPAAHQPAPSAPRADQDGPFPQDGQSGAERAAALVPYLRRELASVMELPTMADLDPSTGLFDLGLTSTMVVELRSRLERDLGREIPATVMFTHPTISQLARYLADGDGAAIPRPRGRKRAADTAEPLAIVGMGCRFPGGANDLAGYWRLLREGRDATSPVPPGRWDRDAAGAYPRRGGFLDVAVDEFDADAFGIAPREARSMDPQQRLLLEVAWEALEDAGCTAAEIEGSATAVFVGINTADYMQLLSAGGSGNADAYLATGNTFSVAAGRLSYFLGAQGPSMAVDTACSSSLVAAHLASRSLRSGESDMAIVAGVNLMLSPATTLSMARLGALSPDGRCKTFDASADGYGRGEGCGVVVLKRLSDAVASGDRIWAMLRGSAVNQDGRSAGLTVPNGQAQQLVIREALREGGIDPDSVSYVEAHGTGTPLGDPMEISALVEVLRPDRGCAPGLGAPPLRVGSVKTNIGHLEAAAGISSLIKVALSLHHGEIPAHLHVRNPNPHLRWDELPVEIPAELLTWKQAEGPRIAGISSFGFSGTNAHVVLEEAPPAGPPGREGDAARRRAELLVLSARTQDALRATAERYQAFLEAANQPGDTPAWADITRMAARHRTHLPMRMSVVAASAAEAADLLAASSRGERSAGVRDGQVVPEGRRLIFVYSGQGCQWAGMGRGLLDDPASARILRRCDELVRDLAGWSLLDELRAEGTSSRLSDTAIAQPAIFAVQAALTQLWSSWGIAPDAVLGHSVGEVAAAYAAGCLDLSTAVEVVVRRGQVMGTTRGQGAMAAVGLPAELVSELIGPYSGRLSIAAVNSPVSTVISGDRVALAVIEPLVRERRVPWATIQEEYAFHSPAMLPIRQELTHCLRGISPARPARPIFSAVTGTRAAAEAFDASYWADNVIQPVRFCDAVRAAAGDAHTVVVELGPHRVLGSAVSQSLEGRVSRLTSLSSMRAGMDSRASMIDAAGGLHVLGYDVHHHALQPGQGRRVSLPGYPWQRQRYWLPEKPSHAGSAPVDETDEALSQNAYEIEWRSAGLPERPGAGRARAGTWLVLPDCEGVADHVVARLEAAGERCRVLHPARIGPAQIGSGDGLGELVADEGPVRGLLHFGTLDASPRAREPGPELDAALSVSCAPLLAAPRMLPVTDDQPAPRLWVITRGGVSVGDAQVTLAHAPVWGLGRVVALEHPEIWGGLIDLDPAAADQEADLGAEAAAIAAEVLRPDGEDQIAYRGGERRVARLTRADHLVAAPESHPLSGEAAYLVTGGRGALGLRIARWLAEKGARHLVLAGRRPLPDRADDAAVAAIQRLREAGVSVYTPTVDVADAPAMTRVFDDSTAPWPAIRGVVHAAGLFDPCALSEMDWDRFRMVLRAKVEGTLVLDALASRARMDFFVMFSSAASIWGSALAGHYAAANHFQDVMAHDRARRGLPGLAVNWGWWSGSEMVAPEHVSYFESIGLRVLPDGLGFAALERLLGSRCAQLTIAPVDWARFRPVLEAKRRRPLLELMAPGGGSPATTADEVLLGQLRDAPGAGRRRLLEDRLQREVAAVLGRDGEASLDRDFGFFDAGMDSIMSVELKNRLDGILGVSLPATATFEHPTIAALAEYLLTTVLPQAGDSLEGRSHHSDPPDGSAPQRALREDELAARLERLSEEELLELLGEELEAP